MKVKALTSGLLLAAGLLASCGGTETMDVEAPMEKAISQELRPTCPSGYTSVLIWECPLLQPGQPPCHYYYGGHYNEQHLYCQSSSDWYDAGPTGSYSCGDCY